MKKIILCSLLTVVLVPLVEAQPDDKTSIINDYFEAFNQHQVVTIVEMVSEDIKMYSVAKDTVTEDISGREALRKWLTGYFEGLPNVYSEISDFHESGNYVSFTETVYWGENRSRSASSMAVYEILNNKIHRIWYFNS